LTLVPSHPTVRINRREDKTLNLNLKVKPDGHLARERQLLPGRAANMTGGEFRRFADGAFAAGGPRRHEGRFPQISAGTDAGAH
jgi:hypothetical protein